MAKILALDIGDQWTGIALSDASKILAKPYMTVEAARLAEALREIFEKESIETVVVGYPRTMKGTESAQTQKVIAAKEELEKTFRDQKWVLWDERLSSKRADVLKKGITKEDKLRAHAVAAAFILDSYLLYSSNR